MNAVMFAVVAGVFVALWLAVSHDALSYYTTPLSIRGYAKQHRFLRPSGPGGHLLGIAGTLFLFGTLAYVVRKRSRRLANAGSVPRWLEAHIFCGVFGPILITYHTSLKFNGLVSVAYWSMIVVMLSGFVGRYLYVRIPKTIRGDELSRSELEARAAEMKQQLATTTLPASVLQRLDEEETKVLSDAARRRSPLARMVDAMAARRRGARLGRDIRSLGLDRHLVHEVLALTHERAMLLRRIERLERTRRLFQLWHVFHRPFVWVMFFIFFIHLGVTMYFGYTPFFGE